MIKRENGRIELYCENQFLSDAMSDQMEVLYENGDGSIFGQVLFDEWKVENCGEDQCILTSQKFLPDINVELALKVSYSVHEHLLTKKIVCYQNQVSDLRIAISQRIRHKDTTKIWSFGGTQNPDRVIYGGFGRQSFPAAGMLLENGNVLGILMDTGIANEWSRWHLRRTADGNAPVVSAYDPMLLEESVRNKEIRINAGQYYPVHRIPFEQMEKENASAFGRRGYVYLLECNVLQAPAALTVTAGGKTVSARTWDECGRQVLELAELDETALLEVHWKENQIELLHLYERNQNLHPWHHLKQDEEKSYRYFFFVDRFDYTIRNLRKYSQIRLAEALEFEGTAAEKILYADFKMLNWMAEPGLDRPLCVPSIDYFEMYFRDVFWSVNGVEDEWLNTTILKMVERTMDAGGWVDNIITPYFGSIEKTDNEINYLYLIWNYLNQKRFGHKPDRKRLEKVVHLLTDRYDLDKKGRVKINNPQSLMDVMWQDHPSFFAVSQGYYCVAMKTALAFEIPGVDIQYVERTRREYAAYYREDQKDKKYLQTFLENGLGQNGEDMGIISCLDMEPEFLSLYLFGESLLGKQIVIDTLNQMPIFEDCLMPIIAYADGTFFTRERNPFSGGMFWEPGRYANGGSYLRPQYIAMAVGKYHGWEKADLLMEKRIRAEFETCEEYPVSIEYLHTLGEPQKASSHKVFAWNVFVNQINRWIRSTIDHHFQVGGELN